MISRFIRPFSSKAYAGRQQVRGLQNTTSHGFESGIQKTSRFDSFNDKLDFSGTNQVTDIARILAEECKKGDVPEQVFVKGLRRVSFINQIALWLF